MILRISNLGQPQCFNIGQRTGMTDAAGSEAWSYDVMGRPLADQRTTNSVTKTTSYAYNLDGSVASFSYPSGRVVTYTPSGAGRTLSAVDSIHSINYATGAVYSPAGALSSLTNGANTVSTLFYNSRLQPCRISVKSSGTGPGNCSDTTNVGNVLDLSYNFALGTANNGNVMAIASNRDATRSQSFTYDQLNRLATAKTSSTTGTNCWGETFSYDIWANLLSIGAVSGYTGCTQENLSVTVTTSNRISGDTYDASGNLTLIPGTGGATYGYNAESQLTSANGISYTYDGDGRRVQKSSGKLYWYAVSDDVLDETDLSGNLTNEYIFFGGKRIARRDSSGNVNYYFADHLGTARIVTNATGTVLDDSDFYPFGGERVVLASSGNTYKFTGKERDGESGLDDFGARFYASGLGRFLTPDWSSKPLAVPYAKFGDPQSLNLYGYVENAPLNRVDPDGHWGTNLITSSGQVLSNVCLAENAGNCSAPPPPPAQKPPQPPPQENRAPELMVTPHKETDIPYGKEAREQIVDYTVVSVDANGKATQVSDPHKLELNETLDKGNAKKVGYCDSAGKCAQGGVTPDNPMKDKMAVTSKAGPHMVTKRFQIDGHAARIYDPVSGKAYNFVRVDASVKKGFVFNCGNDPN